MGLCDILASIWLSPLACTLRPCQPCPLGGGLYPFQGISNSRKSPLEGVLPGQRSQAQWDLEASLSMFVFLFLWFEAFIARRILVYSWSAHECSFEQTWKTLVQFHLIATWAKSWQTCGSIAMSMWQKRTASYCSSAWPMYILKSVERWPLYGCLSYYITFSCNYSVTGTGKLGAVSTPCELATLGSLPAETEPSGLPESHLEVSSFSRTE